MSNATRLSVGFVVASGALLASLLTSCGGGSTNPTPVTTPTPTPTPCTRTPLATAQGPVPAGTVGALDFTTTATGRIDVTLDWTFPTSAIGMYLVRAGTCDLSQFASCPFLIRSDPSLTKPRKASAENVTAGSFELLVINFSADDESLAGQVVLSQGSCAAAAAPIPGVASSGFRARGRVQP